MSKPTTYELLKMIYASSLSTRLKATVAMLVSSFGTAGEDIRPSVERAGWMLGKTARQMRADLQLLTECGVLIPNVDRHSAGRRPINYTFEPRALPTRAPWEPSSRRLPLTPNPEDSFRVDVPLNAEENFRVGKLDPEENFRDNDSNAEAQRTQRGSSAPATRKFSASNPEGNFRQSCIDPASDPDRVSTSGSRALPRDQVAAQSGSEKAREPNGDNFQVIRRLAIEVASEGRFDRPDRFGDLVEAVKQSCASRRINYSAFNVVHRACAAAQLHHMQAVVKKRAAS